MNKIKIIRDDAGRKESGFFGETNDCAVRAFSRFLNKPYWVMHAVCKWGADRKDNRGTFTLRLADRIYRAVGLYYAEPIKNITAGQFIRNNPRGKFVIRIHRHVFAVVDGVVYDTFETGLKSRVKTVWHMK